MESLSASKDGALRDRRASAMSSPSNTKRPIRFAIPRPSGGLTSMSMSAPVTVAPRYKPRSFSPGALCRPASVSRQSRHRPPSQRRTRKLCDFQSCFVCFGIGMMLDASANVIALLIQNVAIRPSERSRMQVARRFRTIGIGMVVASLIPFAIGMTVAATHWRIWLGRWISPSLHRKPAGGRQRGAFRRWLWVDFTL
jgi:hypothetical protein